MTAEITVRLMRELGRLPIRIKRDLSKALHNDLREYDEAHKTERGGLPPTPVETDPPGNV